MESQYFCLQVFTLTYLSVFSFQFVFTVTALALRVVRSPNVYLYPARKLTSYYRLYGHWEGIVAVCEAWVRTRIIECKGDDCGTVGGGVEDFNERDVKNLLLECVTVSLFHTSGLDSSDSLALGGLKSRQSVTDRDDVRDRAVSAMRQLYLCNVGDGKDAPGHKDTVGDLSATIEESDVCSALRHFMKANLFIPYESRWNEITAERFVTWAYLAWGGRFTRGLLKDSPEVTKALNIHFANANQIR